jgi:hypothetical protein
MFSLARQAGVSLADLQQANCITDPTRIYIGQVLVVPPNKPVGSTPGAGPVVVGCANPAVRISNVRSGATLRGTVTIIGTASLPTFSFYKLEVRPDNDPVWRNFATSQQPLVESALGRLDTTRFPAGLYWIQLTVVDNTGNIPVTPCAVRVRFAP